MSPAARALADYKGINLEDIGEGSGPKGVIIKQDVENFVPSKATQKEVTKEAKV